METTKLLQADYLDIIYDHRNKMYGGYELRKHYNQRLKQALLFMFAAIVALCCISFIRSDKPVELRPNTVVTALTTVEIPKAKPELNVESPKPVEPPRQVKTKLFTPPIITSEPIRPDEQMTQNRDLLNVAPGIANNDSGLVGDVPLQPGKPGTGIIDRLAYPPAKPVVYVEQMPQFVGDMGAYISSNLRYPESARTNGIDGRVLVQFVVNEDGSVTDARVVRGIGGGCDEEALRMVNGMPNWKPGRQNGTAVKVLFTLPIKFVLD
jgi:protein TonB